MQTTSIWLTMKDGLRFQVQLTKEQMSEFQQVNGEGTSTRKRGTANGTDKLSATMTVDGVQRPTTNSKKTEYIQQKKVFGTPFLDGGLVSFKS